MIAGFALPRPSQLPRDARDTLFLLAVIAWTVAPHLMHLPIWCGAMTLAVLAWRGWLTLKAGSLPSRWLVAGLLMLAAAATWWQERTLLGKEAGITMLVVLVALKTLELRARRDALVVFFLGFFLVLTHFLYSQALLTGCIMTQRQPQVGRPRAPHKRSLLQQRGCKWVSRSGDAKGVHYRR